MTTTADQPLVNKTPLREAAPALHPHYRVLSSIPPDLDDYRMSDLARCIATQEAGLLVEGPCITDLVTGEILRMEAPADAPEDSSFYLFEGEGDGVEPVEKPDRDAPTQKISDEEFIERLTRDVKFRTTDLSLNKLENLARMAGYLRRARQENPKLAHPSYPNDRVRYPWGLGMTDPEVLLVGEQSGDIGFFLQRRGFRARHIELDYVEEISDFIAEIDHDLDILEARKELGAMRRKISYKLSAPWRMLRRWHRDRVQGPPDKEELLDARATEEFILGESEAYGPTRPEYLGIHPGLQDELRTYGSDEYAIHTLSRPYADYIRRAHDLNEAVIAAQKKEEGRRFAWLRRKPKHTLPPELPKPGTILPDDRMPLRAVRSDGTREPFAGPLGTRKRLKFEAAVARARAEGRLGLHEPAPKTMEELEALGVEKERAREMPVTEEDRWERLRLEYRAEERKGKGRLGRRDALVEEGTGRIAAWRAAIANPQARTPVAPWALVAAIIIGLVIPLSVVGYRTFDATPAGSVSDFGGEAAVPDGEVPAEVPVEAPGGAPVEVPAEPAGEPAETSEGGAAPADPAPYFAQPSRDGGLPALAQDAEALPAPPQAAPGGKQRGTFSEAREAMPASEPWMIAAREHARERYGTAQHGRADVPVSIAAPGWERVSATPKAEEFSSRVAGMTVTISATPTPLTSEEELSERVGMALASAPGVQIVQRQPLVYQSRHADISARWSVRYVPGYQLSIGCSVHTPQAEGAVAQGQHVPLSPEQELACAEAVAHAQVDGP